MKIRSICAIAACKVTRSVMRLLHRGGTALPGKAARLFDPDILKRVSAGMETCRISQVPIFCRGSRRN